MICTDGRGDGRGEDLVALALGQLSEDAAREALAHVAGCAACEADLAATQRLVGVARAIADAGPHPESESRLLAAFRAERGTAPAETIDVPPPARRRRSAARLLSILVPAAAAAAVLVAVIVTSREPQAQVIAGEGLLLAAGEDPAGGRCLDHSVAFRFGDGDEICAGAGQLSVRLTASAADAAPSAAQPAPGTVEMTLSPGARLVRRAASELELLAGGVEISAGPLASPFVVRHGDLAATVHGTRFLAVTAEMRLVVVVREGAVELGRGGGPVELLGAGEQGLVDSLRLLRRPADARRNGDAFLTPRVALARGAAPLAFEASLSVGEGGPVSILPFDDAEPRFLVRVQGAGAPGDGSDATGREVKLQRAMLAAPPPQPEVGRTWRLGASSPYRVSFSLDGIGLPPGRYRAAVRYMSYRPRGSGAEWLGVVESEPVDFEVTEK